VRHQLLYIGGTIILTPRRGLTIPLPGKTRHQTGELQQVQDAKECASLPHNDFRIRSDRVGPKRSYHRHAATAACRSGYSVRQRRRADGRRKDGRDGLCGQAAPKRRKGLHSELSYKQLECGRFIWLAAKTVERPVRLAELITKSVFVNELNGTGSPPRRLQPLFALHFSAH
jgi:hypothetical protein